MEQNSKELTEEGFIQVRKVDVLKAQGRLEWILKNNPDINPERLSIPPEIIDMMHFQGSNFYLGELRRGLSTFLYSTMGAAGFYLGAKSSNGLLADISQIGLVLAGVGIGAGLCELKEAIKIYKEFKKSVCFEPLSEKERRLGNYVFMNDEIKKED